MSLFAIFSALNGPLPYRISPRSRNRNPCCGIRGIRVFAKTPKRVLVKNFHIIISSKKNRPKSACGNVEAPKSSKPASQVPLLIPADAISPYDDLYHHCEPPNSRGTATDAHVRNGAPPPLWSHGALSLPCSLIRRGPSPCHTEPLRYPPYMMCQPPCRIAPCRAVPPRTMRGRMVKYVVLRTSPYRATTCRAVPCRRL